MSGVIGTSGERITAQESYGNALAELGRENEKIAVLDTDLAVVTKTGILKKAFPGRHIDCGIAECNMMGAAARLAATGMVPSASSFTMFTAGRALEQVHDSIGYPHLNMKIGATRVGIPMGEDEATHQYNEDIALMWTISRVVVVYPSGDVEAKAAVHAAAEYDGPVYLRFRRLAVPAIGDREDYNSTIGKGVILREGRDVTIVTTGLPMPFALEMAALLGRDGIDTEVINTHTTKPLDGEPTTASARKTGRVVIVGEHSVIGGLGSVVCDALYGSYPVPVKKIGMQDQFGGSGPVMELIHKYGLDGKGIYAQMKEYLGW